MATLASNFSCTSDLEQLMKTATLDDYGCLSPVVVLGNVSKEGCRLPKAGRRLHHPANSAANSFDRIRARNHLPRRTMVNNTGRNEAMSDPRLHVSSSMTGHAPCLPELRARYNPQSSEVQTPLVQVIQEHITEARARLNLDWSSGAATLRNRFASACRLASEFFLSMVFPVDVRLDYFSLLKPAPLHLV